MRKLGWFAAGVGATIAALAVLGTVDVATVAGSTKFATDTTGSYEIDLALTPGRRKPGGSQVLTVRLLQNNKPLQNAQVSLTVKRSSGTSTETVTTDSNGLATQSFVSFKAQDITITAAYKTSGGKTVQATTTGKWCNCPGSN